MLNARMAIATAAVGGALIAAPVATAAAAPADPVPGTNCTVGQLERAIADIAPEAIPLANKVPGGRAEIERIATLPPNERMARIHQIGAQNPELAAYYNANSAMINQKAAQVVASCAKY